MFMGGRHGAFPMVPVATSSKHPSLPILDEDLTGELIQGLGETALARDWLDSCYCRAIPVLLMPRWW